MSDTLRPGKCMSRVCITRVPMEGGNVATGGTFHRDCYLRSRDPLDTGASGRPSKKRKGKR